MGAAASIEEESNLEMGDEKIPTCRVEIAVHSGKDLRDADWVGTSDAYAIVRYGSKGS